jgi:hypothetical protein
MDDQYPAGGAFPATTAQASYTDRSIGLIVFGVLTIGLGCLTVLLIFVTLASLALPSAVPNRPPLSSLVPAFAMQGALAIALVWLGIGSILARRWARALLLIFSWSWLVVGLFIMFIMAIVLPMTFAHLPTTGATHQIAGSGAIMYGVMAVTFMTEGFLFVVLPGIWIYFYSGEDVKDTCAARHPAPGWTDACPLPVLAVSLWSLFSVPVMLATPLTGHPVLPFFGMFLTGWAASILHVVLAVVWCCAAWLLYRLDRRGWWLIVAAMSLGAISTLLTYMHHDIVDMYRLMDMPQAQLDQLQKNPVLKGSFMVCLMPLSFLPFLGYLLFIRRYFRRPLG